METHWSKEKRRRLRKPFVCFFVTIAVASVPAAAHAEGSSSVAGAPSVVFGQQDFGTTVGGTPLEKPTGLASFWSLPVVSGDEITIDWEATLGSSTGIHLYPVGEINDYNDQEAHTVAGQGQSDSGKNELHYTAPTTGDMILAMVTNHSPGAAYNFIAYVRHTVTVALPRLGTVAHIATVEVEVHAPDGGQVSDPKLRVTLEGKGDEGWKKLGSSAVSDSVASVEARIPRLLWGRKIFLRATVRGPSYASARSSVNPVSVRQ